MKRAWLLLLLLLLLPQAAFCETELQQPAQELLSRLELSAWQQELPQYRLREHLERYAGGDFSFDAQEVLRIAREAFFSELSFSLPLLIRSCAICLLMGVLARLHGTFAGEDAQGDIAALVLFLCAALPLATDFMRLVQKGQDCVSSLNAVAQCVLPTMLALLGAAGGAAATAAMEPLLLSVSALSTQLTLSLLLPLVRMLCVLTLISCMSGEKHLSYLIGCLRSACHWILGFSFTAFLGLLAAKGMGASGFDAVVVRTAKYTVDNLVPVIGGLFKDSVETLAGCALIVKNAVGAAGLVSLLLCLIKPAGSIFAVLCGYRLCAALLQPLGKNRLTDALEGFASALQTLLICLLVCLAVFFVFVSVLMLSGAHL